MLNVNQTFVHALHDMVVNQPDKLVTRLAAIFTNLNSPEVDVNGVFNGIPVDAKVKNLHKLLCYLHIEDLSDMISVKSVKIINATSVYATIEVVFTHMDIEDLNETEKSIKKTVDLCYGNENVVDDLFEIEYL